MGHGSVGLLQALFLTWLLPPALTVVSNSIYLSRVWDRNVATIPKIHHPPCALHHHNQISLGIVGCGMMI